MFFYHDEHVWPHPLEMIELTYDFYRSLTTCKKSTSWDEADSLFDITLGKPSYDWPHPLETTV